MIAHESLVCDSAGRGGFGRLATPAATMSLHEAKFAPMRRDDME